jgi:uncharacterized protein YbdZ (MbtH family)
LHCKVSDHLLWPQNVPSNAGWEVTMRP